MSGDDSRKRRVSVRRVADEATATLLRDFLRSQGVEAQVVPAAMPWLGGIEQSIQGYWGHVDVLEPFAERALALIEDFYAAEPEPESRAEHAEEAEGEAP